MFSFLVPLNMYTGAILTVLTVTYFEPFKTCERAKSHFLAKFSQNYPYKLIFLSHQLTEFISNRAKPINTWQYPQIICVKWNTGPKRNQARNCPKLKTAGSCARKQWIQCVWQHWTADSLLNMPANPLEYLEMSASSGAWLSYAIVTTSFCSFM